MVLNVGTNHKLEDFVLNGLFSMKKVSTSQAITKEIKQVFNQSLVLPDGLITNQEIRDQFIKLMKDSHCIPANQLLVIWKLIEKQMIIPVNNKKKGLLGMLFNKLKNSHVPFSYSYDDGTMAFYSGVSNRMYIMVDNIMKANGNADGIARTVVHELQHMQCHNFPSEFFSVHKDLITSFYFNLFDIISGHKLKVNDKSCLLYAKFLLYMFDDIFSSEGAIITESDFDAYRDKVAAVYMDSKFKIPQDGMDIAEGVTECAESMIDGKFFTNAAKKSNSVERYMYMAIGQTYKKLGMDPNKLKSFFGQECIVPSEIVAMIPAIKIQPNLFAFLNRL